MDQRFSLGLVALALLGGALALWLSSGGETATPVAPANTPIATQATVPDGPTPPAQSYTLTVSWHPAFCETKPRLDECRGERASDYTADHFALHGLWAEDEYCGVDERLIATDGDNKWSGLPEIDVSDATWRDLQRVMPGSEEQLERHEWIFHGTCSGAPAERYFSRAIALVEAVNKSEVRDLLARNIGRHVSRNQIRAAFDAAFGDGAGRKVRLDCDDDDNRGLIAELRINLDGDAMGRASLADLIHAGRNASAGCNGGIVDRVGEQ